MKGRGVSDVIGLDRIDPKCLSNPIQSKTLLDTGYPYPIQLSNLKKLIIGTATLNFVCKGTSATNFQMDGWLDGVPVEGAIDRPKFN
jgi:hypothetical protein